MDRRIAAVTVFAALALGSSTAFAATPTAVQAAHDATQKAKAVTFALLQRGGSGSSLGTVTLQRIGSTRSRIRIQLTNPAAAGTRVTLRDGRDCLEPRVTNAPRMMQLNPFTGRVSESIVQLPIESLRSGHYLLDVQNATARQQAIDACAQLNGNLR